jgi:pyruvate/2-oxoglutarate dehydrogenase complex dihydrolipoamide dehydrogenase (E3) component
MGWKKASNLVIPWATYTQPEIAHVGLSEADADKRSDVIKLNVDFAELDRAILDGATTGYARVYAKKNGEILGATIVGDHASDLIGELVLAQTHGLKLSHIASTIHPYPTKGEIVKRLGDAYMRTKLTPTVGTWLARFLAWTR